MAINADKKLKFKFLRNRNREPPSEEFHLYRIARLKERVSGL
jgi:hypothetical protein